MKGLESLIDPEQHQVFLVSCPARVLFATHPWFVVNQKGSVSRWGVSFLLHEREESWGHLNRDLFPPFQGLPLFTASERHILPSKVLGSVLGDEYSLAARMTDFILRSPEEYPFRDTYSLLGPNSNTYAQWVLDHFPEAPFRLPWNALGKTFQK